MPFIEIKVWEGKTKDKEGLIKDITDAVVKHVDCPIEAVHVCITEVSRDNWSKGGVVSSKLDL